MYCAISGTVPDEPVVAKPTGHLYERRLIEKHVAAHGTDPVTGAPLTADDLLPIAVAGGAAKPRPSPATSVPGLLGLLHNEWDAAALETHTLRTALNAARQDLAHALYQHDAALRVIARLVRERDAARDAYEARGPAAGGDEPAAKRVKGDGAAETAPALTTVPEAVVAAMTALSADLSKGRKKRVPPSGCVAPSAAAGLSLFGAAHPVTKTRTPGVRALAVGPAACVALAGADGGVAVWEGDALTAVGAHPKGASGVAWLRPGSLLASAGADGGGKLWARDGDEWREAASLAVPPALAAAAGPTVAVAAHPSGDYVALAAAAGAWTLHDAATGAALAGADDAAASRGVAAAAFHPDGVILGTGTAAGALRVWDARAPAKPVASFDGHAGGVAGAAFSENGYHAAAAHGGGVRLWDLRKLKAIASADDAAGAAGVAFDPAGLLLAAAGAGGVRVLGVKTGLDTLVHAADGRKGALSVGWAPEGDALWCGGGDHNLRCYRVKE